MKVLNLYSGIGGNRKLWTDVEVTAVELNEEIAGIYKDYFPQDEMIIADAHEYLLKHYKEFDFIWSSPPCPTHSRLQLTMVGLGQDAKFPDMKLYQEIIFLENWFKGKWVVENVIPYYEPLISPTVMLERHFFWSNFLIKKHELEKVNRLHEKVLGSSTLYGFSIKDYKLNHRKDQIMKNIVNPDLGLYILEQARGIIRESKTSQLQFFPMHPP